MNYVLSKLPIGSQQSADGEDIFKQKELNRMMAEQINQFKKDAYKRLIGLLPVVVLISFTYQFFSYDLMRYMLIAGLTFFLILFFFQQIMFSYPVSAACHRRVIYALYFCGCLLAISSLIIILTTFTHECCGIVYQVSGYLIPSCNDSHLNMQCRQMTYKDLKDYLESKDFRDSACKQLKSQKHVNKCLFKSYSVTFSSQYFYLFSSIVIVFFIFYEGFIYLQFLRHIKFAEKQVQANLTNAIHYSVYNQNQLSKSQQNYKNNIHNPESYLNINEVNIEDPL